MSTWDKRPVSLGTAVVALVVVFVLAGVPEVTVLGIGVVLVAVAVVTVLRRSRR